jgi:hypothetical protein
MPSDNPFIMASERNKRIARKKQRDRAQKSYQNERTVAKRKAAQQKRQRGAVDSLPSNAAGRKINRLKGKGKGKKYRLR